MSANVNAQLGLVITASDKASPIFEAVARNIMKAFEAAGKEAKNLDATLNKIGSGVNSKPTEEALNNIDKEVQNIGKHAHDTGEKIGRALEISALQDVGARFEHLGSAITGFFMNAINEGARFEQQITATAATLNSRLPQAAKLSTVEIDALNRKALELGKTGYFSANEVAEGMYTLAAQGIEYKYIMGGAIEAVQDLAVATDQEMGQTANVVSDIIHEMKEQLTTEFGPNLKDQFTGVANMISGSMHNARISMDDFINTLKYVGPQASAVGMSLQDVSTAVALLGERGIRGSQAGTTLRRMLTNLTPVSDAAAEVMKKLGIITEDGANKFYTKEGRVKSFLEIQEVLRESLEGLTDAEQQYALKTMFGQYALSGMTAIAHASKEELDNLNHAVTGSVSAHDLAAQKWDNAAGTMRRLRAAYETTVKEIGEKLLPVAILLMTYASQMLGWFNNLSPSTKEWALKLAFAGGILTLVTGKVFSTIASFAFLSIAIKGLFPGLGTLSTASSAAGSSVGLIGRMLGFLTNPIGLTVAALAILGTAFVAAYKILLQKAHFHLSSIHI